MTHKRRRLFAFALVMCLLFGLLPGKTRAEEVDAPAAETPLDAVPATQTPTEPIELTEAETVSLSKDEVRVIKGKTTTLTAEIPEAQRGESPLTTSSAIVWTSSNPEVATVDSNGVVTGIELGEATITATLNGAVIETFTVYSTLEDGYYEIENSYNTYCFYPEAMSMSDSVGVNIMPIDYLEEEVLFTFYDNLKCKWYIKFLGDGAYAIHPVYSSGMVLSLPDGTTPVLQPVDSATQNYWHWNIVSSNGGYVFVNKYYSARAIAFPSLDDAYGSLTTQMYPSNSPHAWSLVSTTVSPGLLLFDMRSGELVADDLQNSSDEIISGSVYVGVCKNQAYALNELGLYLQPLDPDPELYNQTHIMTFSDNYATFNLSTLKITGTQIGYTDAAVKRAINSTLYSIDLSMEVKESENLTVKYDYAYANRYTNLFVRLNTHTQTLVQKFRKEFNIFLNISTPTGFQSYGDMCPNNSYFSNCGCTDNNHCNDAELPFDSTNSDDRLHHKNAFNIICEAAYDITEKTLIYIGHNTCRNSTSLGGTEHTTNGLDDDILYGLALLPNYYQSGFPGIVQVANHVSLTGATRTTIHEVGHLFGALDHYPGSDYTADSLNTLYDCLDFSEDCMYGENKENSTISEKLIVCEGCQKLISGALNNNEPEG